MPEITPITVQGIVHSDPKCFRSLYDAYYAYLCGLAVSYIHDFEKARELVNDVFLRVWERRAQLKYPPLPYLISGVRNACYNYLRDNKKESELVLSLLERMPDIAHPDANPDWGFDKDFYIKLNLALGGSWGGAISPAFTTATYKIDWIRVYQ